MSYYTYLNINIFVYQQNAINTVATLQRYVVIGEVTVVSIAAMEENIKCNFLKVHIHHILKINYRNHP